MTQSSAAAQSAEHSLAATLAAPMAYWQTFIGVPLNFAFECAEEMQRACFEGVAAVWLRPGMTSRTAGPDV